MCSDCATDHDPTINKAGSPSCACSICSAATLAARPTSCAVTSQTSSFAATSPTLDVSAKWFWITRNDGRPMPFPAACTEVCVHARDSQ